MIRYVSGNLLDAEVEALVAPVNTVGACGKGLALQFAQAFPVEARAYQEACQRGQVQTGRMFTAYVGRGAIPRWLVFFPTKRHWRNPSRLEWIREGLVDLARVIVEEGIASIGLPALGCGLGGLCFEDVQPEIEAALGGLEGVKVLVYLPLEAAS